jgi:hypothetical protein
VIRIIPNAGHTFEESRALGRVGEMVSAWLSETQNGTHIWEWFADSADWFFRLGWPSRALSLL